MLLEIHILFIKYLCFTSLPQIYFILIISKLHSYGTKMFPQFE